MALWWFVRDQTTSLYEPAKSDEDETLPEESSTCKKKFFFEAAYTIVRYVSPLTSNFPSPPSSPACPADSRNQKDRQKEEDSRLSSSK